MPIQQMMQAAKYLPDASEEDVYIDVQSVVNFSRVAQDCRPVFLLSRARRAAINLKLGE